MGDDVTDSSRAWRILEEFTADPMCVFLEEAPGTWPEFRELTDSRGFPQRLWTDAYIAALALSAGAAIVTFDRDFSRWKKIELIILSDR